MPSPFPGMDPYLEDRSLWPDLHQRLITYIAETLQPQVRPKYIARIGERIELANLRQGYIPNVLIVEPTTGPVTAVTGASTLVADAPMTFAYLDEERHTPYIEIIYRETGDVVTVIEVLSPVNKVGDGREKYLAKQADLLTSHTNLVEIDLLGMGRPTTLARALPVEGPVDWRYTVSTSRASQRKQLEVYAFTIKDRFPRCRIPLRAADPDVVLDLPTVFTRCYDVGGYDLLIDYTQEITAPLSKTEAAWVQHYLREHGLRSS